MKKFIILILASLIFGSCSHAPAISETNRQVAQAQQPIIPLKTTPQYKTVSMDKSLLKRDADNGVVYLTPANREKYHVVIENGIMKNFEGKIQEDTHNSHNNRQTYVMDQFGNFYLFDEHTHKEIRHSSILAGGPVSGAGEITIANGGQITYLDSDSGHYASKPVFHFVTEELAKDGVNVSAFHAESQKAP